MDAEIFGRDWENVSSSSDSESYCEARPGKLRVLPKNEEHEDHSFTVKAFLDYSVKKFKIFHDLSPRTNLFSHLLSTLRMLFGQQALENHSLMYRNEEGQMRDLASDAGMQDAVRSVTRQGGKRVLKVIFSEKKPAPLTQGSECRVSLANDTFDFKSVIKSFRKYSGSDSDSEEENESESQSEIDSDDEATLEREAARKRRREKTMWKRISWATEHEILGETSKLQPSPPSSPVCLPLRPLPQIPVDNESPSTTADGVSSPEPDSNRLSLDDNRSEWEKECQDHGAKPEPASILVNRACPPLKRLAPPPLPRIANVPSRPRIPPPPLPPRRPIFAQTPVSILATPLSPPVLSMPLPTISECSISKSPVEKEKNTEKRKAEDVDDDDTGVEYHMNEAFEDTRALWDRREKDECMEVEEEEERDCDRYYNAEESSESDSSEEEETVYDSNFEDSDSESNPSADDVCPDFERSEDEEEVGDMAFEAYAEGMSYDRIEDSDDDETKDEEDEAEEPKFLSSLRKIAVLLQDNAVRQLLYGCLPFFEQTVGINANISNAALIQHAMMAADDIMLTANQKKEIEALLSRPSSRVLLAYFLALNHESEHPDSKELLPLPAFLSALPSVAMPVPDSFGTPPRVNGAHALHTVQCHNTSKAKEAPPLIVDHKLSVGDALLQEAKLFVKEASDKNLNEVWEEVVKEMRKAIDDILKVFSASNTPPKKPQVPRSSPSPSPSPSETLPSGKDEKPRFLDSSVSPAPIPTASASSVQDVKQVDTTAISPTNSHQKPKWDDKNSSDWSSDDESEEDESEDDLSDDDKPDHEEPTLFGDNMVVLSHPDRLHEGEQMYASEMKELMDKGFTDKSLLVDLLVFTQGDADAVYRWLQSQ